MKFEYKEKTLAHLESINKRAEMLDEMLEGKRPVSQEQARKATKEIKRLVELSTNIVDIS